MFCYMTSAPESNENDCQKSSIVYAEASAGWYLLLEPKLSQQVGLLHFSSNRVDIRVSPVKWICVFEHSVMTHFNCACPAIQRGQGSGFLSEGFVWLTACMSEQRRFWRDCADAWTFAARIGDKYMYQIRLTRSRVMLFPVLDWNP